MSTIALTIEYHDDGPDDLGRRCFTLIGEDGFGQCYFANPAKYPWYPLVMTAAVGDPT